MTRVNRIIPKGRVNVTPNSPIYVNMNEGKKACVISAGGSLVAYTAGILNKLKPDYHCVAGSSAGALIAALVAAGKYETIKDVVTNVEDDDIYSFSPWNRNGRLHVGKLIYKLIKGLFVPVNSIGEGKRLRALIEGTITNDIYREILEAGKEVIVSCQEYRWSDPEIYYAYLSKSKSGAEMRDFTYYSACAPFMFEGNYKMVGTNELGFIDSGVTEILPLKEVIRLGYKEIDVFMHRHKHNRSKQYLKDKPKNLPSMAFRMLSVMRDHIEQENLAEGLDYAREMGCKVTVRWLDPAIDPSSGLHFDKEVMRGSYGLGRNQTHVVDFHDYSREETVKDSYFKEIIQDEEMLWHKVTEHMKAKGKDRLLDKLSFSHGQREVHGHYAKGYHDSLKKKN